MFLIGEGEGAVKRVMIPLSYRAQLRTLVCCFLDVTCVGI